SGTRTPCAYSSVAPGAVFGGVDLGRLPARRLIGGPRHVRDLVLRTQVLHRIAVALEAPAHADRLIDPHDVHLVDAPVARHAPDPRGEVRRVVEVRVIGQLVELDPLDGHVRFPALLQRGDARRVVAHDRVAAHAYLRGRDHRLRCALD